MNDRESYSFLGLPGGGLLLNLFTGGLFRLNESAALIWRAWLSGTREPEIAAKLAAEHGLAPSVAARDVALALASTASAAGPSEHDSEYRYERTDGGFSFSKDGTPLVIVDERGEHLSLAARAALSPWELVGILQAVSPKLMALRGNVVMHAAAVSLDGAILAISGVSGAGKTTTARALVRAGAAPLSEDRLIIRTDGERVEGLVGDERAIGAWAAATAADLAARRRVATTDLDRLCDGRYLPVREVGFVDAARRSGDAVRATELDQLAAATGVFRNCFYGSDRPNDWSRQLLTAVDVAKAISTFELTMPAGLAPLDPAARAVVVRRSFRS